MELIVVLVLLGLSISLITPSLSQFSKSVELKASTKRVAAILRYGRSEAINKGKVYQILFDSNLKEVKIQSMEPAASEEEKSGERREAKGVQKTFALPSDVQIKEVKVESTQYPSDLPAVEFYPNGGSNGGNILLDTLNHKGYKIKIHFLTGTVAIEKV